jgi:hypothetical protein
LLQEGDFFVEVRVYPGVERGVEVFLGHGFMHEIGL